MVIRALSLRECDRFNSTRATVARHIDGQAVEWFADDTDTVLGAISYHHADLEWSSVVLGPDDRGGFRALNRDAGLRVLDEARRLVIERMTNALAARERAASKRCEAA